MSEQVDGSCGVGQSVPLSGRVTSSLNRCYPVGGMTHSLPEGQGRGVGSRLLELQMLGQHKGKGPPFPASEQGVPGAGDRPTLSAASQRWRSREPEAAYNPSPTTVRVLWPLPCPSRLEGIGLFRCVSISSGGTPVSAPQLQNEDLALSLHVSELLVSVLLCVFISFLFYHIL